MLHTTILSQIISYMRMCQTPTQNIRHNRRFGLRAYKRELLDMQRARLFSFFVDFMIFFRNGASSLLIFKASSYNRTDFFANFNNNILCSPYPTKSKLYAWKPALNKTGQKICGWPVANCSWFPGRSFCWLQSWHYTNRIGSWIVRSHLAHRAEHYKAFFFDNFLHLISSH